MVVAGWNAAESAMQFLEENNYSSMVVGLGGERQGAVRVISECDQYSFQNFIFSLQRFFALFGKYFLS
jgi:hypothetical protein